MDNAANSANGTEAAAPHAALPVQKKALSFHVSDKALVEIEKLHARRMAEGKPRSFGLRVGIRGGGCTGFGYLFEWCDGEPRKTDRIFEFAAPSGEGTIR